MNVVEYTGGGAGSSLAFVCAVTSIGFVPRFLEDKVYDVVRA